MNKETKKKFYFTSNYGFFFGKLNDNLLHKHFASQITIAESNSFELISDDHRIKTTACYIEPNQNHRLKCESDQLTILINPLSRVGHYLNLVHKNEKLLKLNENIAKELRFFLIKYIQNNSSFDEFCQHINSILNQFLCNCEEEIHIKDDRILKAIHYLDMNFERTISLKEVADYCFLSEGRLLHLFKEKTGLNFRRYQLWNKLIKSLPSLTKNNITITAHQHGFSDSSHYTKTFKETFGVTPKFFLS